MKHMTMAGRILCLGIALICCFCALAEEVPAVTEDETIPTDIPLTDEEKKEQLRYVQQMLIDLGYLTGAADGILGPRTANALKAFQARNGLEQTGELDGVTLMALDAMAETVRQAAEIQKRLIELNYMGGTADGIFGEISQRALRQFQTMNGLPATGELDDDTRMKLFSEDAQALPPRLRSGDKGEAVQTLQERLVLLGFLGGETDGVYGAHTAEAVSRFQRHLIAQGYGETLEITDNGVATGVVQALLFDEAYSSYIHSINPGDVDEEVLRVENRLNKLGYMDMTPDKEYDDYAVRAAAAFKRAVGIGGGDTFDAEAFDALFSADAPGTGNYIPHDIVMGDTCEAVRDAESALIQMGMLVTLPGNRYGEVLERGVARLYTYLVSRESSDAALFEDPKVLSIEAQEVLQKGLPFVEVIRMSQAEDLDGETGEGAQTEEDRNGNSAPDTNEVLRLQRRLHTLYFLDRWGVDGKFGESSVAAVSAFQAANGLPETGIADEATQRLMFSEDAVCDMRPYRIEVSIDRQRVYCYQLQDDGEYELVRTCICSTGLHNSTPKGIFLDGFPVNRWHYFSKFNCWAQYSFDIEGDIMFHSVLYSAQDVNTLRMGSVYALGSKASHGCIRLKVEDAKWIFTNCKRGSLVILIY